jgi:hypothetical protein
LPSSPFLSSCGNQGSAALYHPTSGGRDDNPHMLPVKEKKIDGTEKEGFIHDLKRHQNQDEIHY